MITGGFQCFNFRPWKSLYHAKPQRRQ